MNKRDNLFNLIDSHRQPVYTPAAFFLHFDPAYHRGRPAVEKHLEFSRFTGMDLVKVQYERSFPHNPEIQQPRDWADMPLYKEDFYADQIEVVEGLVRAAKDEAVVVITLYSPFMLAGQTVGSDRLNQHLRQDPEAVKPGLEIITESLLYFVRGCIRAGVDGFYASSQGGEANRFPGTGIFEQYIKPFDLAIWEAIHPACPFNILHVCDYQDEYTDYTPFLDYPGQVVSASQKLVGKRLAGREISRLFGRPFMGGMERLGVIAHGSQAEIRAAAQQALDEGPERFILAADCTVPSDTAWENLKTAIDTAHAHHR